MSSEHVFEGEALPSQFSPGETVGHPEHRRRQQTGADVHRIDREPSHKEARSKYEKRTDKDLSQALPTKKPKTVHKRFGPNEKAKTKSRDGPLDNLLDTVLRMDSMKLIRMLILGLTLTVGIALTVTYVVMRKFSCHPGFVRPRDKITWEEAPTVANFDAIDIHHHSIRRCLKSTLSDQFYETGQITVSGNDNEFIKNVSFIGYSALGSYKSKYSIFSNVSFEAPFTYTSLEFKNCLIDGWEETEQSHGENSKISDTLIRRVKFHRGKSLAGGDLVGNLIGLVRFLGTAVFQNMKLRESVVREVLFTAKTSFSSVKIVKTFLKTIRLEDDVRFENSMFVTSKLFDCRIEADLAMMNMRFFKTDLQAVVDGQILLKDASVERTKVHDLYVKGDLIIERLTAERGNINNVHVTGALAVEGVQLTNSSVNDGAVRRTVMMSKASLDTTDISSLYFYMSVVCNGLKLKQSAFDKLTFVEGLAVTSSSWKNSTISSSSVSGIANFQLSTISTSVFQDVVFRDDVIFTESSITKSSIGSIYAEQTADFSATVLKKVVFENATFAGHVDFRGAKMTDVKFIACTFSATVDFSGAKTKGVVFKDCIFQGHVELGATDLYISDESRNARAKRRLPSGLRDLLRQSQAPPAFKVIPDDEGGLGDEIVEETEDDYFDFETGSGLPPVGGEKEEL